MKDNGNINDEYIDIVTQYGTSTQSTCLKSVAHQRGLFHNTVHVWLYTKTGTILLQQRAASKSICPLLWDVSAAGHVDADETIINAAIRETKEELGLTLSEKELFKIGVNKCMQTYNNNEIIDNEFHHVFVSRLNVDISKLSFQKDEVEALKLVSIDEFLQKLEFSEVNNHFVSTNKAYYLFVLDEIKKLL